MTNFPSDETPTHLDFRSIRIYMVEQIFVLNNASGDEKVKLVLEAVMGICRLMGNKR